jgi:hypothetical protein
MEGYEDLDAVVGAYRRFRFFLIRMMMRVVPVVAVIYGAVKWKPYFFFLGLAGIILVWWIRNRMDNPFSSRPPPPATRP